jgi:hypothetical protein
MTGIMPCTCSSVCRADSTCTRLPRFQARLDAAQDAQRPRIRWRTEACANHLGVMVTALTTWAREQDLTNAELTILTIEPPPRESYPRKQRHRYFTQTSGFIFSIIHLDEPESAPASMHPAVPDASDQASSARPARICSDQVLNLGLLAAGGNGARALIPPNVHTGVM